MRLSDTSDPVTMPAPLCRAGWLGGSRWAGGLLLAAAWTHTACTFTASEFTPTLIAAAEPDAARAGGEDPSDSGIDESAGGDGSLGDSALEGRSPDDGILEDVSRDDGAPGSPVNEPVEDAGAQSTSPDVVGRESTPDAGVTPRPIVGSFPADGARGVSPEVILVIDFGRAMNTSTVPGSIVSDDISLAGASFGWNANDSVVRITLAEPLQVARGSDSGQVAALCYSYRITDAALDGAGQPTTPQAVTFCTARRISQRLSVLTDPDLTGSFRSDGVHGDGSCARTAGTSCIGDSGFASNAEYRAFLTFDSTVLPESIEPLAAELEVEVQSITGTPFEDLGEMLVEHARFARIGIEAFSDSSSKVLGPLRRAPDNPSMLALSVADALRGRADRYIQYRLRFAAGTDKDGRSDHIAARPSAFGMRVDYLVP